MEQVVDVPVPLLTVIVEVIQLRLRHEFTSHSGARLVGRSPSIPSGGLVDGLHGFCGQDGVPRNTANVVSSTRHGKGLPRPAVRICWKRGAGCGVLASALSACRQGLLEWQRWASLSRLALVKS